MTAREQAVLNYMQEMINKNGYPPAIREICAALNIKSTSTVHKAIASLQDQGFIQKTDNKRRAIRLSSSAQAEPQPVKATEDVPERADIVDIPVVGRIAAGTPILAEQNIEDSFPLPSRFVGRGNNFMLTVHGESMIEAGIFDGDYILVEQNSTANNGEIVVAMIDGMESECTVKTFYKESGHIRLQPENPTMDPIIVPDCKILGKVKGVFRYLN